MSVARILFGCLLAAFLAAGLSVQAEAAYLPLSAGNTWSYVTDLGREEVRLVSGTTEVFGREVWVIEHPISYANLGLENYWTSDDDGNVLLHGFWRAGGVWGRAYDPPVVLVDAPLFLGKTWSATFDIHDLSDLSYLATYTIHFSVVAAGVLAVPAGDFDGYGIVQVEPERSVRQDPGYALSGRRMGAGRQDEEISEWWSEGVGTVRYRSVGVYDLVSYEIESVGGRALTLSAVKAIFR